MNLMILSIAVVVLIIILLIAMVYLFPEKITRLALTAERTRAGLVSKSTTVGDLYFAYLEGGDGEPLLLLHGFGGNKDTFVRVARYLVKHYRVIIPDCIGFGDSSHPDNIDYHPVAQAERIRKFVHALGIKECHLAGNSMGGQLALLYAAKHPTEVKSLWLISPAGIWSAPGTEVLKQVKSGGSNPLVARNVDEFRMNMALGMKKPPYVPLPMLKVLARERIENAELEEIIFEKILACSVEDGIRGLEVKTLVTFGEHDSLISPETADVLKELMPNTENVILKNAAHVSMFEEPVRSAEHYHSFMGKKM